MTFLANRLKMLALGTALTAAFVSGAWAQDVNAALERLTALMSEQGVELAWENANIAGADATLTGVTIATDDKPQPIGDIELTGIADVENGYRIDHISMPSYTATESGGTVTLTDVEMEAVFLPAEGVDINEVGYFFYERASLGEAHFETDGRDTVSLVNLSAEITPPEEGGELAFRGGAEHFSVDLSAADNPQQQEVLSRLGYEQMAGSMAFAGSWNASDGRLTLSQYDFIVDEAGTLSITFDISGYTPAFIKALRETSDQMAASSSADTSAQGMAMLGLMQQISLYGMEISFADASLTERVLEFAAQDQGVSATDVANQTKAVLPLLLAQINAPQFAQMASDALSAFLDDPQSLTIRAAPAEPVPFALLLATGMMSPDALAQQLGLTVTAND